MLCSSAYFESQRDTRAAAVLFRSFFRDSVFPRLDGSNSGNSNEWTLLKDRKPLKRLMSMSPYTPALRPGLMTGHTRCLCEVLRAARVEPLEGEARDFA